MNFVQNCWSCSCYPCVANAQVCVSFTHRFDAQIAMHSAALLLASALPSLACGTLRYATKHSSRRPRTACGAHGRIDFACWSTEAVVPRASRRWCSRSRTAGRCRDSEGLARLTFVQAVRRARPQVLHLGQTRRSPSWLLSAGPAQAPSRKRGEPQSALTRRLSARDPGPPAGGAARDKDGGLALPPRPDGPRARHARGHVAPGPHHR